jgi:photosystem II stability/assembly factor-like uncharacterized protein
MRMRLIALALVPAGVTLAVAGCGSGSPVAAGGAVSTSSSAATGGSAATATPSAAGSTAGSGPASGSKTAPACRGAEPAAVQAGALTGIQFVSATQGWAVGQDTILETSDAGASWVPQLSGKLNLTSVDFIGGQDGWAVGATALLATTDGGAHWTQLPEPCPLIRSVHFISPETGFAVAGGSDVSGSAPGYGGTVLGTSNGGRSWQAVAAPADAQTVCFSNKQDGWLGANGLLYRTSDGGRVWMSVTTASGLDASGGADGTAAMNVECSANGSAWALSVGPGAAMSQDPHVGYHADQSGATAIFAEQYFQTAGSGPSAQSPGSDAGPFSAIDSSEAVFIDSCPACGDDGTVPWDVATASGATLLKEGNVGSITDPGAASFLSPETGWVTGTANVYSASGASKSQQRIVATADGGRSWHVQWTGPWS